MRDEPFVDAGGFGNLGRVPEGPLYFQYAVATAGTAYTADAAALEQFRRVARLRYHRRPGRQQFEKPRLGVHHLRAVDVQRDTAAVDEIAASRAHNPGD